MTFDPDFQRQLDQATSQGSLRTDELPRKWWTRYLVDTDRVSIGYDLGSWALPILVAVSWRNIHIQVLCVDMDFYFGEVYD